MPIRGSATDLNRIEEIEQLLLVLVTDMEAKMFVIMHKTYADELKELYCRVRRLEHSLFGASKAESIDQGITHV